MLQFWPRLLFHLQHFAPTHAGLRLIQPCGDTVKYWGENCTRWLDRKRRHLVEIVAPQKSAGGPDESALLCGRWFGIGQQMWAQPNIQTDRDESLWYRGTFSARKMTFKKKKLSWSSDNHIPLNLRAFHWKEKEKRKKIFTRNAYRRWQESIFKNKR